MAITDVQVMDAVKTFVKLHSESKEDNPENKTMGNFNDLAEEFKDADIWLQPMRP